jgi:hypothetical protein
MAGAALASQPSGLSQTTSHLEPVTILHPMFPVAFLAPAPAPVSGERMRCGALLHGGLLLLREGVDQAHRRAARARDLLVNPIEVLELREAYCAVVATCEALRGTPDLAAASAPLPPRDDEPIVTTPPIITGALPVAPSAPLAIDGAAAHINLTIGIFFGAIVTLVPTLCSIASIPVGRSGGSPTTDHPGRPPPANASAMAGGRSGPVDHGFAGALWFWKAECVALRANARIRSAAARVESGVGGYGMRSPIRHRARTASPSATPGCPARSCRLPR